MRRMSSFPRPLLKMGLIFRAPTRFSSIARTASDFPSCINFADASGVPTSAPTRTCWFPRMCRSRRWPRAGSRHSRNSAPSERGSASRRSTWNCEGPETSSGASSTATSTRLDLISTASRWSGEPTKWRSNFIRRRRCPQRNSSSSSGPRGRGCVWTRAARSGCESSGVAGSPKVSETCCFPWKRSDKLKSSGCGFCARSPQRRFPCVSAWKPARTMSPMNQNKWLIVPLFLAAGTLTAQTKSVIVEEIVARVNNDVITREDLEHARKSLAPEVQEECQNCTPDQVRTQIAAREKNLLRDLIDQSLLVQRAKDDNINVDGDVIKRLDAIRVSAKLPDMETVEKEVTKSGQDFEDFKSQIKNQLLTRDVIRKEVGSRIIISHEDVIKYYEAHKQDFVRPEMVVLREIFVSTEKKPEADIPTLRKKAENLRDRVLKNGDDFGELAKRFSDSPTAQQSGELGAFERSKLDPNISEKVFALNRSQMTDVIETKTGFEILQVRERYQAGEQPLDKVDTEITNHLYEDKMEPGLRAYLKTLREDSYLQVKPGYTDSAAVTNQPIEEVAVTPDKDDKKKSGRKLLLIPKKKSAT